MPEWDPSTRLSIFGPINEGASAVYEADIAEGIGDTATAINGVTAMKMKLFDQLTGVLVRKSSNVLSSGEGGSISDGNHFKMEFRGSDNVVLNQRLPEEDHVALFEFQYPSGTSTRDGKIAFVVRVRNLGKVGGH